MKYKIIIIVFSVIFMGLTSCNSCTSQKQNDHNLEECTEHDHSHDGHNHNHATPAQESFKVEADSAAVKHDHDHSDPNHKH